MDYKKLIIRGISYSQTQSGAYALLLEHEETSVKLPVVIGNFEAQSISLGLEKDINPVRKKYKLQDRIRHHLSNKRRRFLFKYQF
jgi:bifunctional DNase/RNase